jgi:hypothetical protein
MELLLLVGGTGMILPTTKEVNPSNDGFYFVNETKQ